MVMEQKSNSSKKCVSEKKDSADKVCGGTERFCTEMCLVEKEHSAQKYALQSSRKNSLPRRKISTEMRVTEQKKFSTEGSNIRST